MPVDAVTSRNIRTPADEYAARMGYVFRTDWADHAQEYIETYCRHSKGEWAGQTIELLDWERDDFIRPLFGWAGPDGYRRFKIAFVSVAKKNGKSTLASCIASYMAIGDGEPGAEVYIAAADKQQAGIVYDETSRMIRAEPELRKLCKTRDSVKNIAVPSTNSFIRVISRDSYTAQGLNIHSLEFDELHAQKSRELWDALRYGGAARRQPLLLSITTAGHDRTSICWEQYDYARKVLSGDIKDEEFFALIYEVPEDADWTDPDEWRKANPSLGHTVQMKELAQACKEAQNSTTKENSFRRYRLNQWTEQEYRWLSMDDWRATIDAEIDPLDWREAELERRKGQRCYGGLDLGSTRDLTAFVLLFRDEAQSEHDRPVYTLLPWFWCPESGAEAKDAKFRELYRTWGRDGFVRLTPGDSCDYGRVEADISALAQDYGIEAIAVDRLFQGAQLSTDLAEKHGLRLFAHGQGFLSMAAPSKRFEELTIERQIQHGGNPVLQWMASNVTVKTDTSGNIKPVKPDPMTGQKVDGIVASIMALAVDMVNLEERSVYEERGIFRPV